MPATELQHSFRFIVGIIQHQTFWKEIDCLRKGKVLSADLQGLIPYMSESAIGTRTVTLIRVGGRLENEQIPVEAKYPLLLLKDHKCTYKLVEFLHQTNMHAGPKALIGILCLQVWIVNSRRLVSKVVRNCVHCYHYKPHLLDQIMGLLPADRLSLTKPFAVSGVDLYTRPIQNIYGRLRLLCHQSSTCRTSI